MRQTFTLAHAEARQRALRAVQCAPDGFCVVISEPKRNLEQNARLHALFGEIAERKEWMGTRLESDDWKRLIVAAWQRAIGGHPMVVPAIDRQGFDVIYRRTSTLTKNEMSELIDYAQAWWSEQPESQRSTSSASTGVAA